MIASASDDSGSGDWRTGVPAESERALAVIRYFRKASFRLHKRFSLMLREVLDTVQNGALRYSSTVLRLSASESQSCQLDKDPLSR